MNNTWIKLHRNIIDWEWFHDRNCLMLLIYLNCRVNIEDKKWQGIVIKRGSMVLSWETLSCGVKLSIQQCRTAMKKLVDSGEVITASTNRYTMVTLVKWDKMQHKQQTDNKQITNKQQTDNKQITTTKERKERKERKEKDFKKSLQPFLEAFGKDTLNDFYLYWSEMKPNGKKMRYEMEKTFDIKRRLDRWSKNNFNKKGNIDPIKNLTF